MDSKGQTFAAYLAAQYMAKKGFVAGTVPEAQALVSEADIVLTLSDGMRFEIFCIVDREANPGKRFGLSRDAVDEIGKACLKYSGKVSGNRLPVGIHVMEIGPEPLADADRARLEAFKRRGIFSKVHLRGWWASTSTKSVWNNAPFGLGRGFVEGLLRAPRESDAELQRAAPALPARTGLPWLTFALLALLAAVFAGEIAFGVDPWTGPLSPSIRTLVAMGGLFPKLVLESGEWYRLLTAAFLHGDAIHLVFNGIALYMAGAVLEPLLGRVWFLALFVIGALGGSLLSLAINPATTVSVGASGAIMGQLAAAYVCSYRIGPGGGRTQIQMSLLQVLIPSLIPIAVTRTGQHIDYAGHLGGALTGIAVGLLVLKTWHAASPVPRFAAFAAGVCVAGAAVVALAVVPLHRDYGGYALEAFLIPPDQLPKSTVDGKKRSADLVARYPRDPRSRLLRAAALLDEQDPAGAERELRAGLQEEQILKAKFQPELEARLRMVLAAVLVDKGELAEAKAVARPACGTTGSIREMLTKLKVCE